MISPFQEEPITVTRRPSPRLLRESRNHASTRPTSPVSSLSDLQEIDATQAPDPRRE